MSLLKRLKASNKTATPQSVSPLEPLARPPAGRTLEEQATPLPARERLTDAKGRALSAAMTVAPLSERDVVTGRRRFKGRRLAPAELAEAYRHRGPLALDVLTEVCQRFMERDPTVSAGEATKAATAITDRAYGKAPEVVQLREAERDANLTLKPAEMSTEALVLYAKLLRVTKPWEAAGKTFDSSGRLVEPSSTPVVESAKLIPDDAPETTSDAGQSPADGPTSDSK